MSKAHSIIFGDAAMNVWKAASDSGDTLDDLWFGGVLATTSVDRQNEAFTPDCLKSLAADITADPLDLVGGTHSPGVDSVLGTVRKGEFRQVGDVGELYVEGFLFGDDPAGKRTYRQMEAGRVALSIGGKIGKAYKSGAVRYLAAVKPDHALACRKGTAVNADTWTEPLAKAIADAEAAGAVPVEVTNTDPIRVQQVYTGPEEVNTSTSFAENLSPQAPELWNYTSALNDTLRGIWQKVSDIGERQSLSLRALADFNGAVANHLASYAGKAGARHSRADIEHLHNAIATIQRSCGCDACAAVLQAIQAASDEAAKANTLEEATIMAEEAKQEDAVVDEVVEETAVEPTPEEAAAEPVAKSESEPVAEVAAPVDVDAIIAKAVAAGREAATEDADAKIAALTEKLEKAQGELDLLKAAPAPGGPEAKPSGEEEKTEVVAKSEADTMIGEYLAQGDKQAAAKVIAAKMVMPTG